mgnify:CR=1 FL=1
MSERMSGGCLCGKIRFETTSEPVMQILCHCTDCQTVSGSAFYTAYIVPLESVMLTKGEPGGFDVKSDRGRNNRRRFCQDCGTRLWAELEMGIASVNGMALDNQSHFNPTHNHRSETAPDWCALNESLETLPVGP